MSDNSDSYLAPLIVDPARLKREAVRRRKLFDEKSISEEGIPEHEAEGWQVQVDRKLNRKTTIRKEKEIDERLENRF